MNYRTAYRLFITLLLPALLAGWLASPSPVVAAVLQVGPTCSLPDAIQAVNTSTYYKGCDGRGVNTIQLEPGGVYLLTSSLDILKGMTINGSIDQPATIDAQGNDRVIYINASAATVTLSRVTITGGVQPADPYPNGGGVSLQAGTLVLKYVTVENNGYIDTDPTPLNTLGGGIFINQGATARLENSIVRSNQANYGGGIFSYGTLVISASTLSGNTASNPASGGAVDLSPLGVTSGVSSISNSTISANSGGKAAINAAGRLDLQNNTFADNLSPALGWTTAAGASLMQNNLLARQQSGSANCAPDPALLNLLRTRHNLADDGSCNLDPAIDVETSTALVKLSAAPAVSIEGSTPMYALDAGSTAFGAGLNCAVYDQRGKVRLASCTLGSYELEGLPPFLTMLPLVLR